MGEASCTMLSTLLQPMPAHSDKAGTALSEPEQHIHYILGCWGQSALVHDSELSSHKEAYNQATRKIPAWPHGPLKKKPLGNYKHDEISMSLKMTGAQCFIPQKLHGQTPWGLTNRRTALLGLHWLFSEEPELPSVFLKSQPETAHALCAGPWR